MVSWRYPRKGFTLLELLIVIAIIGILSAIVLSAIRNSRSEGDEAKIRSQLIQVRNAADLYYASNGNSYGVVANTCTTASSMFVDAITKMNRLSDPTFWPGTAGAGRTTCYASGQNYALLVTYTNGATTRYYCMDANKIIVESPGPITVSDYGC